MKKVVTFFAAFIFSLQALAAPMSPAFVREMALARYHEMISENPDIELTAAAKRIFSGFTRYEVRSFLKAHFSNAEILRLTKLVSKLSEQENPTAFSAFVMSRGGEQYALTGTEMAILGLGGGATALFAVCFLLIFVGGVFGLIFAESPEEKRTREEKEKLEREFLDLAKKRCNQGDLYYCAEALERAQAN